MLRHYAKGMSLVEKEFKGSAVDMPGRPCRFMSTCALTGEGVEEGVAWLMDSIKQSKRARTLAENIT